MEFIKKFFYNTNNLNTIAIIGDTILKSNCEEVHPFSYEISKFLKTIPCTVLNLETVLSSNEEFKEKAVSLSTNPENVKYLKEIGVKAVNLANNHVFDQGLEGYLLTLTTLESAGVSFFGVLQQGKQPPYIVEFDGLRIGFLGYSIESNEKPEGIPPLEISSIREDVKSLKNKNIEKIIVNLHWGEEYVPFPSNKQQKMARSIIELGVDVIIGHHPHVVQGVEEYRQGVIFYSIGNFNFPTFGNFSGTRWGLIVLLKFEELKTYYSFLPVKIDSKFRPYFPPEEYCELFRNYISRISLVLKPNISSSFWFKEAAIPHFSNHIPSFILRIKKYGFKHFLLMVRWLLSPSNYKYYLGLFFKLFDQEVEIRFPFSNDQDNSYP